MVFYRNEMPLLCPINCVFNFMTRPHLHTTSLLLCCLALWLGTTQEVRASVNDLSASYGLKVRTVATTVQTPHAPSPSSPNKLPGMAVWNKSLYIHTSDTLTLEGDLYLIEASVQGNGAILLKGEATTEIRSHHSSLPNLIIDNADSVILHGELDIRQGLAILRGVFDTRSGNLRLADTASLNISPLGEWLRPQEQQLSFAPTGTLPTSSRLVVRAGGYAYLQEPPASPPRAPAINREKESLTPVAFTRPLAGWKRVPSPPPK